MSAEEIKKYADMFEKNSRFPRLVENYNLDKNYLLPSKEYPTDSKLVESWKIKNTPKRPNFANVLVQGVTHISFAKFQSALIDTWKKFVKQFAPQPYILILPDMECRSDQWIAELLLNHPDGMSNYMPTDVYSRVHDAVDDYGNEISLFLFVDDASYSGTKLSQAAGSHKFGKIKEEPTIVILVPFISSTAIAKINGISKFYNSVTVIIYSQMMPTVREVAEELKIPLKNIEVEKASDLDLVLTYFDHKVADYFSTFPRDIRAMIPECELHADDINFECPMPPYKTYPSCLRHGEKRL